MRNLFAFAASFALLLSLTSTSLAQTNITNNITSNTTWDVAGSPYIIQNSINVQNGVSLTIDAGVEVKFNGSFSISVFGEIKAVGTSTDSIYITSNLASPQPLDWDRILVQGTGSNNSEFRYCRIEFGRIGASFESTSAKISNSLIQRCHRTGLSVAVGSPTIRDNIIRSIVNQGIAVSSGSPLIEGNTIYDNIDGIVTDFASSIIRRNIIYDNSRYGVDNRNADDQNKIALIENNTIDHNGLIGGGPFAANINCDNSSPIIRNNIITNSENVQGSTFGSGIRATSGGTPQISYNDVWNNAGGNYTADGGGTSGPGPGDISADPQFIDDSNANYNLLFGSPCIDAGDPNSPLDPDGTRSDMGALPFDNGTIPVELAFFKGSVVDRQVFLEWQTESETNNFGFEVERQTSRNWSTIGFIEGHGTTTILQKYLFIDKLTNILADTNTIRYRIKQIDFDGSFSYSNEIEITIPIPSELQLDQNFPNPFNPITQIRYSIPKSDHVKLKIYNIAGQEVKTIVDEFQPSGYYQISWDGTGKGGEIKSAGIYYAILTAGSFQKTIRMILLK